MQGNADANEKDVKYVLTLSPEQARIVDRACEFYARITMGQWHEIIAECLDIRRDDFCDVRETVENLLLVARQFVWPELSGIGHSWGLGHDVRSDLAWEIHEVLRHRMSWTRSPEGGYGVNFDPPFSHAGRELAICEIEKTECNTGGKG